MDRVQRALLSVSDKRGLVGLARSLAALRIEILSTGGTARLLRESGIALREVSEVTGVPEMLNGRVKTLHPAIHAGILARRDDPKHCEQLQQQGIAPIDLVVVNLYPFAEAAARPDASGRATPAELIEEIDIGGPTLIRAAAKNFASVAVVVSPDDYARVVEELEASGGVALATRLALARKAFALTAGYDATIASTLAEVHVTEGALERKAAAGFPALLTLGGTKALDLRYGENPHQRAALYRLTGSLSLCHSEPAASPRGERQERGTCFSEGAFGIAAAKQLHGKELSYNNLLDLDAAWDLACEFDECVCTIIKHTNPCGVALGATQDEAYERALACDPVSAFGSIIAFNRPLTAATAEKMSKLFVEAVAAPGYQPAALAVLTKKKNIRLLEVQSPTVVIPSPATRDEGPAFSDLRVRSISGGLLVQTRDQAKLDPAKLHTVTKRAPTAAERKDLLFAWVVAKHVKSNAIVYARAGRTLGIGAGQMSRVDSVKLGAMKARGLGHAERLQGAVLASDAFFPFPDGVEEAARVGVRAVIQPGGSKRDPEVIAAADRLALAMVFTGTRHFRH